jgi:hypothetical protein
LSLLAYARERYGKPQVYAVLLLLLLFGQCLWVGWHAPESELERMYVREGRLQWEGVRFAGDGAHSPFPYLVAGLTSHLLGPPLRRPLEGAEEGLRLCLLRFPFMIFALLLGASVWYVARRLYSNPGGYIALALYCTSPEVVRHGARVGPESAAAWGFFGIVFTGIAVAHTLYAPPAKAWQEARPRLALLGLAVGVGVGSSFSAVIGVPLALAFMLYLVPGSRGRALLMLAVSCLMGLVLLWAAYFLSLRALAAGLAEAYLSHFFPRMDAGWLLRAGAVSDALLQALTLPGCLLLAVMLGAYLGWRRARYFGNTAPLLTGLLLVVWMMLQPLYLVPEIVPWALPFCFVFVAGLCTDLLELRRKRATSSGLRLRIES